MFTEFIMCSKERGRPDYVDQTLNAVEENKTSSHTLTGKKRCYKGREGNHNSTPEQ